MKQVIRRKFASRLTRRIVTWLFVLMVLMSLAICYITMDGVIYFYSYSYHNSMRSTTEYMRRVQLDVYVTVNNNVDQVESLLDRPEELQAAMKRIVAKNKRIRSCGISFVEGYYPQYGRWFCPYAWKDKEKGDITVYSDNMGREEYDYLSSDWFQEALKRNRGYWCDPFFDGFDSTMPLIAYLVPIHDKQGRTVAIMGADLSLDWLTKQLVKEDSLNNAYMSIGDEDFNSQTYIINRKGLFISHPNEKHIMCDNLFEHISPYYKKDSQMVEELCKSITEGKESKDEIEKSVLVDGTQSFLFFMPVSHTDWVVVSSVPWLALAMPGFIIAFVHLLLIVIAIVVIYFICRATIKRMIKPLSKLVVSADEVAKGNFKARLPKLYKHDEIHLLRDSFENMQLSLTNYVDELKKTTASKAAIENELRIAHDIQMSMLPKKYPPYPERSDIDIYGSLVPAKAVGGDLFDFFIRENQLFFCVGDVSGKGIPASLVMAVTRSLFRNVAAHVSNPGRILIALNDAMSEGNDRNMFVTFFVGVLNLDTYELEYCNAGHNAPLILLDTVSMLPVESNLPLGVMSGWEFVPQRITMPPGTMVFLYTDGLSEAENMDHQLFGDIRTQEAARQCISCNMFTSEEFVNYMTTVVHAFVGEAEQSDDLTMLAIKLNNNQ